MVVDDRCQFVSQHELRRQTRPPASHREGNHHERYLGSSRLCPFNNKQVITDGRTCLPPSVFADTVVANDDVELHLVSENSRTRADVVGVNERVGIVFAPFAAIQNLRGGAGTALASPHVLSIRLKPHSRVSGESLRNGMLALHVSAIQAGCRASRLVSCDTDACTPAEFRDVIHPLLQVRHRPLASPSVRRRVISRRNTPDLVQGSKAHPLGSAHGSAAMILGPRLSKRVEHAVGKLRRRETSSFDRFAMQVSTSGVAPAQHKVNLRRCRAVALWLMAVLRPIAGRPRLRRQSAASSATVIGGYSRTGVKISCLPTMANKTLQGPRATC